MKTSEMKVGVELDALIDEKVFGYTWQPITPADIAPPTCTHRLYRHPGGIGHIRAERHADGCVVVFGGWEYSANITAAWRVVEALAARGWKVDVQNRYAPTWACHVNFAAPDYRRVFEHEDTAPLAICKAALVAVEGAP